MYSVGVEQVLGKPVFRMGLLDSSSVSLGLMPDDRDDVLRLSDSESDDEIVRSRPSRRPKFSPPQVSRVVVPK